MARSSGRSSYRPSRSSTRSSRPQTVKRAPAPAPATTSASNGGSFLGNVVSTVAEGYLFSTGSALAHRAADALLGPRSVQHEIVDPPAAQPSSTAAATVGDACGTHSQAFQDCLNNYGSDISRCQFYLDMLSQCKRDSGVISA